MNKKDEGPEIGIEVKKLVEEEMEEAIERVIDRVWIAQKEKMFKDLEIKKIEKRIWKKGIKYNLLLGSPFLICILLFSIGINSFPPFLNTSTVVSFTMFGVLVGLYVAHKSIADWEKIDLLILSYPKIDKKEFEKILTGMSLTWNDLYLMVSYFVMGLLSSIFQSLLLW